MLGIAVGDFNLDHQLDFAVINRRVPGSNSDAISLFLGNGDGTFGPRLIYAAGSDVLGLIAVDLNGDGLSDLAAVNYSSWDITLLLGNSRPGDGVHTYRAWVEDVAGNASAMSAPLTVTIDTTP
jgi:hypothetical protein